MNKTVVIVDDHNLFAQSLKGLVNSFQNFSVSNVFKNGQELIDFYDANNVKPDIVLLDIRMPVLGGIETMEWLRENHPDQIALALSMEHEEETIIKMIKAGCRGYLLKDIEPEEFLFALTSVVESGYYRSEEVTSALNNSDDKNSFDNLTKRELEFMQHACSEMTYKEVASKMNLSPKTIDGYRESLFHKLDVKSRVGLVLFAVQNNIVKV